MRPARLVLSLLLALCVAAPAVAARRARPAPCRDGRFPLGDVAGLDTSGAPATLVLRNGTVALDPACPAVAARVRASRQRTTLAATFDGCAGSTGPVRLKASIRARTCDHLRGRLRLPARPR